MTRTHRPKARPGVAAGYTMLRFPVKGSGSR
jgi:hypothetical protein